MSTWSQQHSGEQAETGKAQKGLDNFYHLPSVKASHKPGPHSKGQETDSTFQWDGLGDQIIKGVDSGSSGGLNFLNHCATQGKGDPGMESVKPQVFNKTLNHLLAA